MNSGARGSGLGLSQKTQEETKEEKHKCKIVPYADTLFCVTHARVVAKLNPNDFPYSVDWENIKLECSPPEGIW